MLHKVLDDSLYSSSRCCQKTSTGYLANQTITILIVLQNLGFVRQTKQLVLT